MRRRLSSLSTRRRLVLGAVVVAVCAAAVTTLGLAAGRSSDSRFCTLIGGSDGVSVDVGLNLVEERRELQAFRRRLIRRHRTVKAAFAATDRHLRSSLAVRRVAVCTAGRCVDVPLSTLVDGLGGYTFTPIRRRGSRSVDVSVIIDRRGRPLQLASGSVRLRRFEPNGPGCGTWWQGGGRVAGDRIEDVPS